MNKRQVNFICIMLCLLFFINTNAVFGQQEQTTYISIRIEGAKDTIVKSNHFPAKSDGALYALDAAEQLMSSSSIEYRVSETPYGKYLSRIGDEQEGTFGGYDGWVYSVNGSSPSVSIDAYELKDGDELVIYYGSLDTYIPIISLSSHGSDSLFVGEDILISVSAQYFDWYENVTITKKIPDANIKFLGETYITDGDGNAVIPAEKVKNAGTFVAAVNCDNEDSYPSIVRGEFNIVISTSEPYDYNIEPADDTTNEAAKVTDSFGETGKPTNELINSALLEALDSILKNENLSEFEIFALAINNAGDNLRLKERVLEIAKESGGFFRRSTDISKLIIAAAAVGIDPRNVSGYDLISKLEQFENIEKQGVNASIFALIAERMGSGEMQEVFIRNIENAQTPDGGIPLANDMPPDVDITAMAIYALAGFYEYSGVEEVIEHALVYLEKAQNADGGFAFEGTQSCESVSQVIIAISALDININDTRFAKPEGDLVTNLLGFMTENGFSHIKGGGENAMATAQAALALTAVKTNGNIFPAPLYKDVYKTHWAYAPIASLSSKSILSGDEDGYFKPDDVVTREQFVKMAACAFNLKASGDVSFTDLSRSFWCYPYICAAVQKGLVSGIGDGSFGIGRSITREDMVVMLYRLFDGSASEKDDVYIRDYAEISDYAKDAAMYFYSVGLLDSNDDGMFAPKEYVTRAQAATLIFRVLGKLS